MQPFFIDLKHEYLAYFFEVVGGQSWIYDGHSKFWKSKEFSLLSCVFLASLKVPRVWVLLDKLTGAKTLHLFIGEAQGFLSFLKYISSNCVINNSFQT